TTNEENRNDEIRVYGTGFELIRFMVYNRWGEKVFETTDIDFAWNGRHQGRELDTGVFAYYLEVLCPDGKTLIKKGDITLIR
ncbi:MAG: gliding motility-associated C-terminal domain-containing protein, partial [Bacteroidetes bacterium]|nr:gliding motility-associated C-terminal domain-containing protein [Bacteroidota bacterium]